MASRLSSPALARAAALHPWRTVALWAAALVAAVAIIALLLSGSLTAQYSFIGNPDSQVGRDLLAERMNMPIKANEVVIVRSQTQTTSDPAFKAFALDLQRQIAQLGPGVVDGVASAWQGGDKTMISSDGRAAILPLVMAGDVTQAEKNIDKVHAVVHEANGKDGFQTLVTGTASINSDFSQTAEHDLRQGEGIGVPIALIILLLVFGTLVAAALPIFLSIIAITFAIAATAILAQGFDVSVFAVNMITMMGLAAGIDYSLFIVSRYREERAAGRDTLDAITVTGSTATRAVFFSGMTVVLALLGMLIVPTNIFMSLALGAILVVLMSVVAALTLLPAVLSLLGGRIDKLRVPYLGRRLLDARAAGRVNPLARLSRRAMKRPVIALALGAGVLLLAAYPALSMRTGVSGIETLPDQFQSKQGFVVLQRQFSVGAVAPVQIVVDGAVGSAPVKAAMQRLETAVGENKIYGQPQVTTDKAGDLALDQRPGQRSLQQRHRPEHGPRPAGQPRAARLLRLRREGVRDRRHGGQSRLHRYRQLALPVRHRPGARLELRAADDRLPVGGDPGKGDRDEPVERERGLRPRDIGVAERRGRGPARLSAGERRSSSGCRSSSSRCSSASRWTTRSSC